MRIIPLFTLNQSIVAARPFPNEYRGFQFNSDFARSISACQNVGSFFHPWGMPDFVCYFISKKIDNRINHFPN